MKIGQLIRRLETMKKKHGNLPVTVFDPDRFQNGFLVGTEVKLVLNENEKGQVDELTFCDLETFRAFQ